MRSIIGLDAASVGAEVPTGPTGEPDGVPFLRFAGDAQEAFSTWLTALERRLRGGTLHPALESHFAKYRSLVPSLALVFHLAGGGAGPVSAAALALALRWAAYLESHALRVYGMAQTPGEAGARLLARRLLSGDLGERFSLRDLYRKGWSGLTSREDAQAAADVLLDFGWLREETVTAGRRTSAVYVVSPRLAGADRQRLLPERKGALTPRRMVTDGAAASHPSASVSVSLPPTVRAVTVGGRVGTPRGPGIVTALASGAASVEVGGLPFRFAVSDLHDPML